MKNGKFLYNDIYEYYKQLIQTGKLSQGERLPSIRKCTELHRVSKTTVDKAYMLLCDDGYVIPKNQSGFYVSNKAEKKLEAEKTFIEKQKEILHISDYTSTGVDSEVFDLTLWTRYVKRALRQSARLMDYGEPQGERELRSRIADYLKTNRSCICNADDLVIGAGVQNLLNILCPLLGKGKKKIYFHDSSYRQGAAVFSDHGYSIVSDRESADILYYSPSHLSRTGGIMSVAERHKLVEYAKKSGKLIIEDDYDSEFRDMSSPTPALQGLDSENVVYLGSFSKLLLPSIRISYMLLPETLRKKYKSICSSYNQTVSIPDQLALEEFIGDKKLTVQIKRARKIYAQKSRLLRNCLKDEFGMKVHIEKTATPLYVNCTLDADFDYDKLKSQLEELPRPVRLIVTDKKKGSKMLSFSVSSVVTENIKEDIHNLRLCIENA